MARPRFKPTDEQRRMVKSMSGVGLPEEDIARTIGPRGISPKTLRKYFRQELSLGSTLANTKVLNTLFRLATSGDCVAASIFWAKTRLGWRERGGPPATPQVQPEEGSNVGSLDQTITDELARLAASESSASVPGKVDTGTKGKAGVPVEGLDGPPQPTVPAG
jgi:hypothetical protein